ncbi:MAG TPA: 3-isopropylmalate dehydrogenase [Candidatus Kryptonia bacterium]
MFNIAVIPGDGIGTEVTSQAVRILKKASRILNETIEFSELKAGGTAVDIFGKPLPEETLAAAKASDAVLLGAVGGPKWDSLPYDLKPEQALLGLRKSLGLYANIRPVIMFDSLIGSSSLKPEAVKGIDIVVVRELTGGIYFGKPAGIFEENGTRRGVNTMTYTEEEIERIAITAFKLAAARKKKVTSVDKANILHTSMLWREVVNRVHKNNFNEIALEHMYVDNAAMQLVRNPKHFDVILTENMFGDILSDEASMLTGSIGMLPSASIGERHALYEPVHGSAPDIAGKGLANPIASILSAAMLLEYSLKHKDLAKKIFLAVETVLNEGYRTADIKYDGGPHVSTEKMGELIEKAI